MNSMMGKILYVDLSTGKIERKDTPTEWVSLYAGQKGLGSRILMEEIDPTVDPFSPDNRIILTTSIMGGTIVSCSSKLAMTTKSPLTGTITDGSVGGHIGAELKYAGFDAVVIRGAAKSLSYLSISPSKVEIRECPDLAGLGTFRTEEKIKEVEKDEKLKVLAIGPAGENRVLFSCVSSERYRQLGRGGIGAVMGSKNLKGIAVRGWLDVHVADVGKLMDLAKEVHTKDAVTAIGNDMYVYGTPILVDLSNKAGLLPTRNFQEGCFEKAEAINGTTFQGLRKNKKACFSCGIACGNYVVAGESRVEGPEYETIALCGSSIGNGDPAKLIELNSICDDLGLDSISAGGVVAYMMEATEKGVHDFGIRFGEADKAARYMKDIAFKRGIGAEAALGSKKLAEKYGGTEFSIAVKGQELPGYDPRGSWGMGIAYVTAPRGGCHMSAYPIAVEAYGTMDPFTFEGKAKLVVDMQNTQFAKFSMGICDFWPVTAESLGRLWGATYGEELTAEQVDRMGERIFNLQRMFNVMLGFDRGQDRLPDRFYKDLLKAGPPAGKPFTWEAFTAAMDEYYRLRGWDERGRPTVAKLKELGIEKKLIEAYKKATGLS